MPGRLCLALFFLGLCSLNSASFDVKGIKCKSDGGNIVFCRPKVAYHTVERPVCAILSAPGSATYYSCEHRDSTSYEECGQNCNVPVDSNLPNYCCCTSDLCNA